MAFVLPPLTDWAEGHLSAILKATTEAEFDNAFDAFISTRAHITVNGKNISREQYKQQLIGESAVNKQSASVQFNGTVEVPTDTEQPVDVSFVHIFVFVCVKLIFYATFVQAGLVGMFYVNTISLKIRVFGAPAQTRVTSSINVVSVFPPSSKVVLLLMLLLCLYYHPASNKMHPFRNLLSVLSLAPLMGGGLRR